MRTFILFVVLISSISVRAQKPLPASFTDAAQKVSFGDNSHSIESTLNKKWFFTTYSSIATSFNFFNGGSATMVTAPLGLQLNRRLNNNFYAFTGVSVAPAYINFNRSFLSSDINKLYPNNGFKSNSFGLYSRAELGLMYVNDSRTFSISGSIGFERSSNTIFPYQPINTTRTNTFIPPNR